MLMERLIRGHKVIYDENAREGLDHIVYDLSYDETYSLFSKAKVKKRAAFEDKIGRNFNLISKPDGSFVVEKRQGWF